MMGKLGCRKYAKEGFVAFSPQDVLEKLTTDFCLPAMRVFLFLV